MSSKFFEEEKMNRIYIDHETIIITGGTSGLGYASAHRVLDDWPKVNIALLDLKEGKSQELITEFGRDRIKFFKLMYLIINQFKIPLRECSTGKKIYWADRCGWLCHK